MKIRKTRRRMWLLTFLFAAMIPAQSTWADDDDDDEDDDGRSFCESAAVQNLWEPNLTGNTVSGKGKVCVTPRGIKGHMKVRGLTRGNAYTIWWVYIDKPDQCFPVWLNPPDVPYPEPVGYAGNCSFVDFFTPDPSGEFVNPLVVFGRMDSAIPQKRRTTRFSGSIRGMKPSSGSQVWMLAFGHLEADMSDRRQLARQLLTPEDPLSGVPHVGIEGRQWGYPSHVAVFTIP